MAWMRRMTGLFTWRRFFLGLGIFALVLLVWFGGPLIAIADWKPLFSVAARLVLLLGLLVAYLLVALWKGQRQRKDNEKVVTEMMASSEHDELLKEEVETQRNNMRKALGLVRQWKPGRFRSVYELPWYMIIGAPGSGKSTALLKSGLEFPLKSEMGLDSIKGVGGTRYCDWWFTNKAVIIDTAGRYTTQESSDRRDAKGWNSFLGLLRKYRSRQPINGVILSVSIADLLEQTPTERMLHAQALKQRVQELRNRLGVVFPVYVVLTKFDLLEGFVDTFSMLSDKEREEVFGITFDLQSVRDPSQLPGVFEAEFDALLERLSHFLLHRLQQERTPDSRQKIYQFPKQVALLKAPLWGIVKEVFYPSAYEEIPLLRGIYLVSSEQQGRSFDKISGLVDRQFHLAPSKAAAGHKALPSEGFFLNRLFENIIFSEHGLAAADGVKDRRYRLARHVAFAAMLVVTVGIAAVWFLDYRWNRDLIVAYDQTVRVVRSDIEKFPATGGSWLDLDEMLTSASGFPGLAGQPLPKGGYFPAGFFWNSSLQQAGEGAYGRLLQYRFSALMKESLEREVQASLSNLEYLYESLKTYLMMGSREYYERPQIEAWFEYMLSRSLPGEVNRPTRESLDRHLANYLALNHQIPSSPSLVSEARAQLTAMPLDERAYQRIKADASMSGLPDFRLPLVLGSVAEEVFERRSGRSLREGIPGLYTVNGYVGIFEPKRDQIVRHLLEDSWVYGQEADAFRNLDDDRIRQLVEERYYRDYIHYWKTFLEDLRIRRFRNNDEGRYITSLLAGPDAPVDRLLSAVKYHTDLASAQDDGNETLDRAGGMAVDGIARRSRMFDRARRLMPEGVADADPTTPVDRAFRAVHEVGEETLQSLRDRARIMARYFAEQAESSRGGLTTVSRGDFDSAVKGIHGIVGNSQSEELRALFSEMVGDARQQVQASSTRDVNNSWRSTVYREYTEAIRGHFPFNRRAETEVSLSDFSAFFGFGGTLERYFDEHLANLVDTTSSPWRPLPGSGISQSSLRVFEQARRIRQAFFEPGTQSLRVNFSVTPSYLDSRLTEVSLYIGDKRMSYRHGPPRTYPFEWPAMPSNVRLALNTGSGSSSEVVRSFSGEWALFRLMDEYNALSGNDRQREIEVLLGGYVAKLDLVSASVRHPFNFSILSGFDLPARL